MKKKLIIGVAILSMATSFVGCSGESMLSLESTGAISNIKDNNIFSENYINDINDINDNNTNYKYNYKIEEVKEVKELLSVSNEAKTNILSYKDTFTTSYRGEGSRTKKINSISYTSNLNVLENSHFLEDLVEVMPELVITDNQITSDHYLVLLNMDVTNESSDEEVIDYVNGSLVGVKSLSIEEELFSSYLFYVKNEQNVSYDVNDYYNIYLSPNETVNTTLGLFIDKDIINVNNVYFRTAKSIDGTDYWIKVPELMPLL